MKMFLFAILFMFFAQEGKAVGVGLSSNPVFYGITSATITTTAFEQVVSAATYAASEILVTNTGASFLILARGASGSEVSTGLLIPPSSASIRVPIAIKKNQRLSLKALTSNNVGTVGITFFQ